MATDGSPENTQAPDAPSARRPVRNMDDITRMFMAGAREVETPAQVVPVPSPATSSDAPAPNIPPANTENPGASRPLVQVIITPTTGQTGWSLACSAAQHLATEWACGIAVVGVHEGILRLIRAGASKAGAAAIAGTSGLSTDVQLARALFGMRENAAHWIIVLPMGRSMDLVLAAARDWLLAAGTDNESVVSAYRVLKNVIAGDPLDEPRATRLFLSCDDYATAAVVHTRLARAARDFLQHELPLAGLSGSDPAPLQTIAEFPVGLDDASAWTAVSEFLHDLQGNTVVEDEELGSPAAQADGMPMPSSATPTSDDSPISRLHVPETSSPNPEELNRTPSVSERASPAVTHEAAAPQSLGRTWNNQWADPGDDLSAAVPASIEAPSAATRSMADLAMDPPASSTDLGRKRETAPRPAEAIPIAPITPAFRAVEIEVLSDETRWNIILASAAELCRGESLAARPPGHPHAALWLDPAGVLHVWMLSHGSADFLSLWQWARDHRQLLALTRPDRRLDPAADIQLHVVLSDGACAPKPQLPGLYWYRLTPIRLGNKSAAVVVPIE